MNILILSNVFPPGFIGGYELGALEIARGLQGHGHSISVLTSDYLQDDCEELADLNVERTLDCVPLSHESRLPQIPVTDGPYLNYRNIRKLGSALRRRKPDLVLVFNLTGLGALGILSFLQSVRVPTVLFLMDNVFVGVDRSSDLYKSYTQIFGEPHIEPQTKVIAMSQTLLSEVKQSIHLRSGDTLVVPGWVQHSIEANSPPEHGPGVRFVYCARVENYKGINLLVQATAELVRRGIRDFTVDVYGGGDIVRLAHQVRAERLDSWIRYAGHRGKDEMVKLFGGYDALIFLTWEREPFGFAVSEAAYAGCVPIMTLGIGASEWFTGDVDCLKIPRNTDSLITAMYQMIRMNEADRLELRTNAMHSARRYLRFDDWLPRIEKACVDTIAARPATPRVFEGSKAVQAAFLFLHEMWFQATAS